jgi:hypothetical protein
MRRAEPDILEAAAALAAFAGSDLTGRIASLEAKFSGTGVTSIQGVLGDTRVTHDLLAAAYVMKRVAGQINVVIHAIGILLCLPHVLELGEQVLSLSLGAGNTGRAFDLVTDKRIGEFKFIHWRGGTETIRQNALFKDLYQMIEFPTEKKKVMYVLGTQHPLKFLHSGRAVNSVMSRNRKLWDGFTAKYGGTLNTVGEYYALKKEEVSLIDVSAFVPGLCSLAETEDAIEASGADAL